MARLELVAHQREILALLPTVAGRTAAENLADHALQDGHAARRMAHQDLAAAHRRAPALLPTVAVLIAAEIIADLVLGPAPAPPLHLAHLAPVAHQQCLARVTIVGRIAVETLVEIAVVAASVAAALAPQAIVAALKIQIALQTPTIITTRNPAAMALVLMKTLMPITAADAALMRVVLSVPKQLMEPPIPKPMPAVAAFV